MSLSSFHHVLPCVTRSRGSARIAEILAKDLRGKVNLEAVLRYSSPPPHTPLHRPIPLSTAPYPSPLPRTPLHRPVPLSPHSQQAQPCVTQFTGSARIAEILAKDLRGKVKLEDAGFDWKILGPDVKEVCGWCECE
ncbi:unnamed protein product [Closterium sp. NIES-53]